MVRMKVYKNLSLFKWAHWKDYVNTFCTWEKQRVFKLQDGKTAVAAEEEIRNSQEGIRSLFALPNQERQHA